jgi:transposase
MVAARFEVPAGWTVQAFQFALDCSPEQAACVRRQFGGRRYARNWAVRTLKEDLTRYHRLGEVAAKPSLPVLRKRFNQVKDSECVDAETGQLWWPEISKEAFADGIRAAVEAYWNWQTSRAGTRAGRRVGFPRFAKKGRDRDRVTFTTGAIRVEPDRRRVTLPRIGCVRVHENTRQLAYKTRWYGSHLTVADRWYPSSKTCHACGRVQHIGWAQHWTCDLSDGGCGTVHQRDDNAAINLARYEIPTTGDSAVGPVRAAVKRGADHKTRPTGQVAVKRGSDPAPGPGNNPEKGCQPDE